MAILTIVFADLTGSTGMFETLGNSRATELITQTTHWMGKLLQARGGRVIKYLGDGVLAAFIDNQAAVLAMTEVQRLQRERVLSYGDKQKIQIKAGLARDDVIEQDGDCFGDAVNVASRLSDLAEAEQIFVSESVIDALWSDGEISYRNLGPMDIRGKSGAANVYRIDWQRDINSEIMTVQASLATLGASSSHLPDAITLSWREHTQTFGPADLPVFIGRGNEVQFPVLDPRASRMHVRLERRGELFVLTDVSSYGTWVRFSGSTAVITLRRQECVLTDKGDMALGGGFDDANAAVISFRFTHMPS